MRRPGAAGCVQDQRGPVGRQRVDRCRRSDLDVRVDPAVLEEQRRRDMADRLQERRIERGLMDSPDVVDRAALEDRAPHSSIAGRHDELANAALRHDVAKGLGAPLAVHLDGRGSERVHGEATRPPWRACWGARPARGYPARCRVSRARSARARTRAARSPYVSRAVGLATAGAPGDRSAWKKSQSGAKALGGSGCPAEPLQGTACHRYPRRILPAGGHAVDSGRPHVIRPGERAQHARIRVGAASHVLTKCASDRSGAGGRGDRGDHPRGRPR